MEWGSTHISPFDKSSHLKLIKESVHASLKPLFILRNGSVDVSELQIELFGGVEAVWEACHKALERVAVSIFRRDQEQKVVINQATQYPESVDRTVLRDEGQHLVICKVVEEAAFLAGQV